MVGREAVRRYVDHLASWKTNYSTYMEIDVSLCRANIIEFPCSSSVSIQRWNSGCLLLLRILILCAIEFCILFSQMFFSHTFAPPKIETINTKHFNQVLSRCCETPCTLYLFFIHRSFGCRKVPDFQQHSTVVAHFRYCFGRQVDPWLLLCDVVCVWDGEHAK